MRKSILALLLYSSSIIPVLAQENKGLYLSDSIVLQSGLTNTLVDDICYIDNKLWVRFVSWGKDSLKVALVSPNQPPYLFYTLDSSIATETCQMIPIQRGFVMPKYSGNTLVFFDTISRNLKTVSLKKNIPRRFLLYPNTNTFFRNDAAWNYPTFFFSKRTFILNTHTEQKLKKSFAKYFKSEEPLLKYNFETHQSISFGRFPEVYKQKSFLLANSEYFFSLDTLKNKLYVSFQATPFIFIYDANTLTLIGKIGKSGKHVDSTKLLKEYSSLSVNANIEFYKLLSDSYENVFVSHHHIFRLYTLGFQNSELISIKPPTNSEQCATPATKIKWYKQRLLKKAFLQQYSDNGEFEAEFEIPDYVNTFIAYNEEKRDLSSTNKCEETF